jgi:hypothetical protein
MEMATQARTRLPILQEPGWAPGLVWMGVDNRKSISPTGGGGGERPTLQAVANRYTDYTIWAHVLK